MDIEMAGSLYPTERAATRAAVSEYLYALRDLQAMLEIAP